MKILLVDNFDSFTYNLLHYLEIAGAQVFTIRNDQIPFGKIESGAFHGIVISPGPKRPEDAGLLMELLAKVPLQIPILGICLGMQAIGIHFGMKLERAPLPIHGKTSEIQHDGQGLFSGLSSPTTVMRYHSLALQAPVSDDLVVTASTSDGIIMGISHRSRPIHGVQFHPESIGTQKGQQMMANWVNSVSVKSYNNTIS